jgi:hypothetical protein
MTASWVDKANEVLERYSIDPITTVDRVDPNTPHEHCAEHGCVEYVCCEPTSTTVHDFTGMDDARLADFVRQLETDPETGDAEIDAFFSDLRLAAQRELWERMSAAFLAAVEHHNGWITRVYSTGNGGMKISLAFRNVADKQAFNYAMVTAWLRLTLDNRPGTVNVHVFFPPLP